MEQLRKDQSKETETMEEKCTTLKVYIWIFLISVFNVLYVHTIYM